MTTVINEGAFSVTFDQRAYSLEAIKKAAYKYLEEFVADIALHGNEITCAIKFTSKRTEESSLRTIDDFKKEALDQDLREKLKAETESFRNLILAHAFSKTGIIGNEQVPEN